MANITTTEKIALSQKSIELALQVAQNDTSTAESPDTAKILADAEKIYNWIIKDKEDTQPQP